MKRILSYKVLDKELYPVDNREIAYSHIGDAGIDLRSTVDIDILPGQASLVGLGIAIQLPTGCFGMLCPRSGCAINGLGFANSIGVIDNGYRGEVKAECLNTSNETYHISRGDRIAQLIVVPYVSCTLNKRDELDDTERGEDGFGSTGTD